MSHQHVKTMCGDTLINYKAVIIIKIMKFTLIAIMLVLVTSHNDSAEADVIDSKTSTVSVTFTLPPNAPTVSNIDTNIGPGFALMPDTQLYAKSLGNATDIIVKDNSPQEFKKTGSNTYQIINKDRTLTVGNALSRITAQSDQLSTAIVESSDAVEYVFVTGP